MYICKFCMCIIYIYIYMLYFLYSLRDIISNFVAIFKKMIK